MIVRSCRSSHVGRHLVRSRTHVFVALFAQGREIEAEEIDELEEDDREKFSDQLECIGFLARQVRNQPFRPKS